MRSDEANRNDCDNDVGRSCAELWPADRASWCQGCLDAHEPSVPVSALRALVREAEAVLAFLDTIDWNDDESAADAENLQVALTRSVETAKDLCNAAEGKEL